MTKLEKQVFEREVDRRMKYCVPLLREIAMRRVQSMNRRELQRLEDRQDQEFEQRVEAKHEKYLKEARNSTAVAILFDKGFPSERLFRERQRRRNALARHHKAAKQRV